jgi:hypothetical protein
LSRLSKKVPLFILVTEELLLLGTVFSLLLELLSNGGGGISMLEVQERVNAMASVRPVASVVGRLPLQFLRTLFIVSSPLYLSQEHLQFCFLD